MSVDQRIEPAHGTDDPPGRRPLWSGWAALFAMGIAAVLVAQLLPAGVVRAVLAVPPVLVLPGFALLTLVLGRSRPADPAVLGVFSVALSLAVLMLDALALNAMTIRLSTASLGLAALLSSGVAMAVATAAGLEVSAPPGSGAPGSITPARPRPLPAARGLALLASVVAGVAVVSVVATRQPAPAAKPFTTLSLGAAWAARPSPALVVTGQRVTIPVVAGSQGTPASLYRLTTTVDGTVASVQSVSLSSSATWHGDVSVVAPAGNALHRVVIMLTAAASGGSGGPVDGQLSVYLDNAAS